MDVNKLYKLIDEKKIFPNSKHTDFEDYRFQLERILETIRPDFVVILNPTTKYSVLYTKNFNLNFGENNSIDTPEIIKGITPKQLELILRIDKECVKFANENKESDIIKLSFRLLFSSSLAEGNSNVFLRKLEFIQVKNLNTLLPLVCVTDVTNFTGLKKRLSFEIRFRYDLKSDFIKKTKDFQCSMLDIINGNNNITEREREILMLISLGKTSKEIANHLFISVATVNTHRQNLIKKFGVKNTASLINLT